MINYSANRTGFHYFPDTEHYQASDLQRWKPHLRSLNTAWLALQAPAGRAIPEPFINGLLQAGIEPVIHFSFNTGEAYPKAKTLGLLLNAYASWGIRYVVFFDRPNRRSAWPAKFWAQNDLVERFLDLFLPLAELAIQIGLTPVLPPLEPGGDYWDTAFFRAALSGLSRRSGEALTQKMAVGACAHLEGRPLTWGAGGPERWPGARPYCSHPEMQDQRGFYIFDWYNALGNAILGMTPPILLFGLDDAQSSPEGAAQTLFPLLAGSPPPAPLPNNLLGAHIHILAAEAGQPGYGRAWFDPDGTPRLAAETALAWRAGKLEQAPASTPAETPRPEPDGEFPIAHYLLLPSYEWGIAEWQLDAIRPFVIRHQPTVGFSPQEAALARRVTIVGGGHSFSEAVLEELICAGRQVEQISGDGTRIATELANR